MTQNYWLFGTQVNILADEQKSGGKYDLIEGTLNTGTETPLHIHSKYSEEIYVLEGEFTIYTPGETATLKVGQTHFIPENTPHVVAATGEGINRSLVVASPSGFAEIIRRVGTVDNGNGAPAPDPETMERFMAASVSVGDSILGPPGARP